MTLTLNLRGDMYYLRENDNILMTFHYGRTGQESPEEKVKRLNVNINPQVWGARRRIVKVERGSGGQLFVALDEEGEE